MRQRQQTPKIFGKLFFIGKAQVREGYGPLEGEGSETELGLGQQNVLMKAGFTDRICRDSPLGQVSLAAPGALS